MSASTTARLFLDNGGHTVKALYLRPGHAPESLVVPNCVGAAAYVGRGIVGRQILELPHYHGFMVRRPVDRGFIADCAVQGPIWEYLLQHFHVEDESTLHIWLTVPFGAPREAAIVLHTLLTVRFKFKYVTFVSATLLALLAYERTGPEEARSSSSVAGTEGVATPTHTPGGTAAAVTASVPRKRRREGEEGPIYPLKHTGRSAPSGPAVRTAGTGLIVDAGFSGTTIVPYVDYMPVYSSIVRIDVGGKILTNRLKEHISFTQTNVMEDGWLMGHIKERCCSVSLDPKTDLAACETAATEQARRWGTSRCSAAASAPCDGDVVFYLPATPVTQPLGCLGKEIDSRLAPTAPSHDAGGIDQQRRSHPQIRLRHERFLVPELIFVPSDIGLCQEGLPQAIHTSLCSRGLLVHMPVITGILRRHLYVTGGTSQLPNFLERLRRELCQKVDDDDGSGYGIPEPPPLPAALDHLVAGGHRLGDTTTTDPTSVATLLPLAGALWLLTDDRAASLRARLHRMSTLPLQGASNSDIHDAISSLH